MKDEVNELGPRIVMASYDLRGLRVYRSYLTELGGFALGKSYRMGRELLQDLEAGLCCDILLMDEKLADMHAFEFLRRLHQCRLPRLPQVVMLSGWESSRARPFSLAADPLHPAGNYCIMDSYSLSDMAQSLSVLYDLNLEQLTRRCRSLCEEWAGQFSETDCAYLVESVQIAFQCRRKMAIRKEILLPVSKRHKVTISAVDSGIRRLIEASEKEGRPSWQAFKQSFRFKTQRPSTGELIYSVKALLQNNTPSLEEGALRRDEQTEHTF